MEVFVRHWTEEVHTSLVDTKHQFNWEQADWVFNTLDVEENGVTVWQ